MPNKHRFELLLEQYSRDLIRIGQASPSRMAEIEASLRAEGERYAAELTAQDIEELRRSLNRDFRRFVSSKTRKELPSVKTWRLERLAPTLRGELDRRIAAAASLIKINRQDMITSTIRRFSGWATSTDLEAMVSPPRNVTLTDKTANDFTVRRVKIDQSQKLIANVADLSAREMGAIAFYWRGVNDSRERKSHQERNGKLYLLRGSWADEKGLVRAGTSGWSDSFDDGMPGIPVYCRCHAEYVFDLDELPSSALTEKGRKHLE